MYFVRVSDSCVEWKSSFDSSIWSRSISTDIPELETVHIVDARPKSKRSFMRQPTESYPIPLLKSNIQKTMRRRNVEACLSTTQQLLRQDPSEALRRLAVIFVEDGQLHPESYDMVVWCMVAHSKGYALTVDDEQLILSATATALSSSVRYALKIDTDQTIGVEGYSLALRSAYGGMKGDQAFLLRLAKRADQLQTLFEWVQVPPFPYFSVDQMIPQSIDFHCSGSLVSWCAQKIHMAHDTIQEAIWWHWSSPNQRSIQESDYEEYEFQQRSSTKKAFMQLEHLLHIYSTTKLKWMVTQKKKVMVQTRLTFTAM
jgi:hypothetical protein